MKLKQSGFTLIEVAIVVVVVATLLGYTMALLPKQQELKQYKAVDREMDQIIAAVIGFAQVNGRLPCPATLTSSGRELGGGGGDCTSWGGFVPFNTLGFSGRFNSDTLLLDPWGNPYRYYVTNNDFNAAGGSDFVRSGQMRAVGLVDSQPDGYIDLDGRYLICSATGAIPADNQCTGATEIFGQYSAGPPVVAYAGAPFVLLSLGKNWSQTPAGDELENAGANWTNDAIIGMGAGTSGPHRLKNVNGGQTTFVKRPLGLADDFDDIVKWASPNLLFSKMIEAGQLP
ncbi:MAG: prepilin-type N-terminal cleavage/methylation domain-containing protein [Gammaproteobacteria bacterium]|nr:prepilin-type N-terminal cleavage/methylation domain-containing protein [Gammaproteobacteria bacterium]